MKKVAIIIASIFLVSALSTVGLVLKKDVEYYINTSSFNTTVAYQEDVDVSTLIIEKYVDGELSNKVPVDKTMIKNCDSTASVGEKSLTIKYNDQEFLINFIVKYKIEFLLDETVIDTQYVLKASEIEAPQDPVKPGFEFIGWDEIPEVINSNKTINALFSNVPSNIPNLGTLTATYGDTLNQFILPSNSEGHWEFVDDLTTTVGNVGKNEFMVQFIPVNSELTVVKDYVYINVSKKKLEFKDIQTEIPYDGNEHIPSYTLDVEGLEVRYNGQKGKEEGSYLYIFTIIDDNYEGNCMGYFNIVPAQVNVKVVLSQYEINLGEAFPTITYEVTGANEEDLQLLFEKPMINHAGEYVVKPTVGNSSYTLVSIEPATLIVKKIYLGPGLPEFLNIPVYGDVLSSVEFLMDNPNGKFEWENPDYVFTTVGEVTVNMIFTPYSTLDYEVEIMPVTFNVPKKELSFNILQSEYVYDGNEHTVQYEIIDNPGNLNVIGNIVRTNVTTETITLEIIDDFYSGSVSVTLKISKATPVTDFTVVHNAYIGQTLNEIALPEGYAWDANLSLDINDEEGTYYGVTYTPVDTLNFEVVKGQMLVKVYKYTPSDIVVNTSLPSSLVYTGDVIDLESYFTSPYIGGKLSFEYQILKDEIYDNIENILNVGAYKIIVTLLENEIYYSTSIEKVISITPANEVVELVKLYATYGDTLSLINIPFESENGVWSWKDDTLLVGTAGTHLHTLVFTSNNENYSDSETQIEVVVAKKQLTINVTKSHYIYDGIEHTIIYTLIGIIPSDEDKEIIVLNNVSSVEPIQKATSLMIEDDNYTGIQNAQLIIDKGTIDPSDIEWPTLVVDYNTKPSDITLPENMTFVSNEAFTEVGNIEREVIYSHPSGYYEDVKYLLSITVERLDLDATITVEGLENGVLSKVYNGNDVVITASRSHYESELVYEYYLAENKLEGYPKNAGEYFVRITLPQTNTYKEVVLEFTLIISQKELTINYETLSKYVYTSNNLVFPTASIALVDNSYLDLEVNITSGQESFLNAGEYVFEAKFKEEDAMHTQNYTLVNNILEIEVQKATFNFTNVRWNVSQGYVINYTGLQRTVTLTNVPSGLTVLYEGNTAVNVGEYTAKVVGFEYDENNYNSFEFSIEDLNWSISAVGRNVIWEKEENYVFNGNTFELPKAYIVVDGENIYLDVEILSDNKVFRNAGVYAFIVNDSNYELSNNSIIIEVEKANIDVNWDNVLSNYSYNGSIYSNPTASIVDLLGNTVELVVNEVNSQVLCNAGVYTFVVSFDAYEDMNNYALNNATCIINIEHATYDMSGVFWDYTGSFEYDGNIKEVLITNLPEGVKVLGYTDNKATNAGTYTAVVSFEVVNTNFVVPEDMTLTWEISQKEAEVYWFTLEEYVYKGSVYVLPTAVFGNVEGVNEYLTVTKVTTENFLNAGTYEFKATLNAEDAINYVLVNDTISIEILQKEVELNLLKAEYEYGVTLNDIAIDSSEFGTFVLSYNGLSNTDLLGNALEEITINVEFVPHAEYEINYVHYTKTITIKIIKRLVVLTNIVSSYEYDGNSHTITYKVNSVLENDTVEILGNKSITNVNESTNVNLYVEHENYTLDKVIYLEITRKTSTITSSLESFEADYKDVLNITADNFSIDNNEQSLTLYIVDSNDAVVELNNAGTYRLVLVAEESANYAKTQEIFEFTINKISPELAYEDIGTIAYTGNAINLVEHITHVNTDNNVRFTFKYVHSINGLVSEIREEGTYTVEITINETTNYLSETIDNIEVVIEKGVYNVHDLEFINAVYGDKLSSFHLTDGWNWQTPTDYVGNVGENYHVAVNGDETVNVKFIVEAKKITITITEFMFDYDGNTHTVEYTLSENVESVYVTCVYTELEENELPINAGGYTFILTIAGDPNYTGELIGAVYISKVDANVVVPQLNATVDDTNITIETEDDGVWTLVGDITNYSNKLGTYQVQVTYTPNSSNYNVKTYATTLTIGQKAYTDTITLPTANITYGDLLSNVTLNGGNTDGTWTFKNPTYLVKEVGENSYDVIFTPFDGNYANVETSITVNVSKKDIEFTNVNSTFGYNGLTQYVTFDFIGLVDGDVINVTGNTGLLEIGSIELEIAIDSQYYSCDNLVVTLSIVKADPETIFDSHVGFTVEYATYLSDIELPEGYSWLQPRTLLSTIKNGQTFDAKFTPSDTAHYNEVTGYFVVNVTKIRSVFDVEETEFVYTGEEIELNATTNNTETNIVQTITGDYDKLLNAGTYTVTLYVAATEHYTEAEYYVLVTILAKEEEFELASEFEYGVTLASINNIESTIGTFTVSTEELFLSTVSDELLGAAGKELTIWIKFIPFEEYANNYKSYVTTRTITIVRKEITFENVVYSFEYDGNSHSVEYILNGLVPGETVDVTGNTSIINVSESTNVTLTIDTDNYYGSLTTDLVITPATPEFDFSTVYTAKYNTKLSDIDLPEGYSWLEGNTTLSTITNDTPQYFDAVYNHDNSGNYIAVGGRFKVTVEKLDTEITTNELEDLVYDPSRTYTISATINHSEVENDAIEIEILYDNKTSVTVLKDAGTYYITVTVPESTHYTSQVKKYTVSISKADATATFGTTLTSVGAFGNSLSTIALLNSNYVWSNPETILDDVGTFEYEAIYNPTDSTNYNSVKGKFYVVVDKAGAGINGVKEQYVATYTGNNYEIEGLTASHNESSLVYSITEMINAGTYNVTITLPGTSHYYEATATTVVVINKASVSLPTGLELFYGEKLSVITLPTSTIGTWAWVNADFVANKIGTIPCEIVFTPNEANANNYEVVRDYASVNCKKIITVVTATIPTDLEYQEDGSSHDYNDWFTVNFGDMLITIKYNNNVVTKIDNAGTYTLEVEVLETAYYTSYSNVFTVNVASINYTPTSIPTANQAIYGDTLSLVGLNGGDTTGTWSWVDGNSSVGNATTTGNTFKVKFTPSSVNYNTSTHDVNVVVGKKTLTFNITGNSFGYNDKVQYITYTLNGLIGSDTVNVTGNDGLKEVGSSTFTLVVESNNYEGNSGEVTLTITVGTPVIILPDHSNITYYENTVCDINLLDGAVANGGNGALEGTWYYDKTKVLFTKGSSQTVTVPVSVTFTPTSSNYKEVTVVMNVKLGAVATYNSTYYGTVEKALADATSGTVSIVLGANPIIRTDNTVIPQGVTLFIPYSASCTQLGNKGTASINWVVVESGGITEAKDGSYGYVHGDKFATEVEGNLRSELIIDEGITVVNKGDIEVAGQLSGGSGGSNAAGQTSGLYSKITMKDNSSLINQGNIYCYGYIDEETKDNGSTVDVESGIVYMPYVLRDFRGGTQLNAFKGGMDSHHVSGFDQYELRNIQTKVIYRYNSKLITWANLYAGDQHNKTSITFIGNASDGFIQFTSDKYSAVEAKFDKDTEVMDIKLIGGAIFNSIKLSIKAITTVTVDTKNVYTGINFRQNISTHQAEGQTDVAVFTLTTNYKLMTGATLTINKGTKVVGEELIIYSSYAMAEGGNISRVYPANLPGGIFVVKGEVSFKKLAGKVIGENSAKISVSNESNTIHAYEGLTVSGSSFLSSMSAWQDMIEVLKLQLTSTTDYVECPTGTYYHNGNGWFSEKPTITYNHNDDSNNITSTTYKVDINGVSVDQLLVPTRKGYTFDGWYYDSELTNKVEDRVCGSFTLYAKWNIDNYTIQYVITKDDSVGEYTLPDDFTTEFNVNTDINIYNPTFEPFIFNGWYRKSNLSDLVQKYDFDTLTATATENGVIVLYGHWAGEIYTINYNLNGNPNGLDLSNQEFIAQSSTSFTPQVATGGNSNISLTHYFVGWYLDEGLTIEITNGISMEELLAYIVDDQVTIYAKWVEKNSLDIKFYGTNLASTILDTVYYIPYNNEYGVQVKFKVPTLDNYYNDTYKKYRMHDASGNLTSRTINGVSVSNGDEIELTTESSLDIFLTEIVSVSVSVSNTSVTLELKNGYVYDSNYSDSRFTECTSNTTFYVLEGTEYVVTYKNTTSFDKDVKNVNTYNGTDFKSGSSFTQKATNAEIVVTYTGSSNCVIEGTLITMADGSQKPVEDVVAGDLLLVFNHETGKFDVSPVIFNEADELETYTIINLEFSNGSIVKIIYEHGFFDINLMQYVYITKANYTNFIGHRFSSLEQTNGLFIAEEAVLVNAYLTQEYTRVYSPVTVHHLNYYTENMLSMPGGITGLFNMFVFGDNLQYDQELMEKDIEMYGLYTYEDFAEYIPYEVFEMFPAAYLKISVAKGIVTFEGILQLIDRYIGIIVDSNM